jgi:hypothetical protein
VTADDANVTPFKVKARTGSEWWYKAKAVKLHEDKPKVDELKGVPIKVGDVVTLAPGAFALETRSADSASAEASASPSDASNDAPDEAAKRCQCGGLLCRNEAKLQGWSQSDERARLEVVRPRRRPRQALKSPHIVGLFCP